MNRFLNAAISIAFVATFSLAACQGGSDAAGNAVIQPDSTASVGSSRPGQGTTPGANQASPEKISVPISIDYSIMGNPIVGKPIAINIDISSPINDRAMLVHYRVNEFGSLIFPDTQVESVSLLPLGDATVRTQQVTVVPQREGRVYLVVSVEIETDGGMLLKSMSIPIQVRRAPRAKSVSDTSLEGPDS